LAELERTAYRLDRVVMLDLPARKVAKHLYEAALAKMGKPLCLAAAEKIAEVAEPGRRAFLLTGFPILPVRRAETDGPPGAHVLARALLALGLEPVFITDETCKPVVEAAAPKGVPVELMPLSHEEAPRVAEELVRKHEPCLMIAIERPGWNVKKIYHTMRGMNISDMLGKTDYLFKVAKREGILTIGIGDGGNELGLGLIIETVREHVPYGAECQCPCKAGIAAALPADVVVIAGTSNWGAYGIAAALSLLKDLDYDHDGKREFVILKRLLAAGAVDGVTGKEELTVDGVPTLTNQLVADLIWSLVNP